MADAWDAFAERALGRGAADDGEEAALADMVRASAVRYVGPPALPLRAPLRALDDLASRYSPTRDVGSHVTPPRSPARPSPARTPPRPLADANGDAAAATPPANGAAGDANVPVPPPQKLALPVQPAAAIAVLGLALNVFGASLAVKVRLGLFACLAYGALVAVRDPKGVLLRAVGFVCYWVLLRVPLATLRDGGAGAGGASRAVRQLARARAVLAGTYAYTSACQVLQIMAAAVIDAARNDALQTPLHCACALASPAAARLLIHAGASASLADKDGRTAVHAAALSGCPQTFAILLEEAVRNAYGTEGVGGVLASLESAEEQAIVAVDRLRDNNDVTPLHCACETLCRLPHGSEESRRFSEFLVASFGVDVVASASREATEATGAPPPVELEDEEDEEEDEEDDALLLAESPALASARKALKSAGVRIPRKRKEVVATQSPANGKGPASPSTTTHSAPRAERAASALGASHVLALRGNLGLGSPLIAAASVLESGSPAKMASAPTDAARTLVNLVHDLPVQTKAYPVRVLAYLCQASVDGRALARFACDRGVAAIFSSMLVSGDDSVMCATAAVLWRLTSCGDDRVRRTLLWESSVLWQMVERVTAVTQKGSLEGSLGAAAVTEVLGRMGCERATVNLRLGDIGALTSLVDVVKYASASIEDDTSSNAAVNAATTLAAVRALGRLARGHFEQARHIEGLGALAELMQRLLRLVPGAGGAEPGSQQEIDAKMLERMLASSTMRRRTDIAHDLSASILMTLAEFAGQSVQWSRSLADAGLTAAVVALLGTDNALAVQRVPKRDERSLLARRAWAARLLVVLVTQVPDLALIFVRAGVVAKLEAMLSLDWDGDWDRSTDNPSVSGKASSSPIKSNATHASEASCGFGFGDDLPHGIAPVGPWPDEAHAIATCGWRRCETSDCAAACVASACEALGALASADGQVLQHIAAHTRSLSGIVGVLPARRRRRTYEGTSTRPSERQPVRRADVRAGAVLSAVADAICAFAGDSIGESAMPPNVALKLSVVLHDTAVSRDVLRRTARALGVLGYGNAKLASVVLASGCVPLLVDMAETASSAETPASRIGGDEGKDKPIPDSGSPPLSLSLRGCAAEALGNLAHENEKAILAIRSAGGESALARLLRDTNDPKVGELDRQCAAVALESLNSADAVA